MFDVQENILKITLTSYESLYKWVGKSVVFNGRNLGGNYMHTLFYQLKYCTRFSRNTAIISLDAVCAVDGTN